MGRFAWGDDGDGAFDAEDLDFGARFEEIAFGSDVSEVSTELGFAAGAQGGSGYADVADLDLFLDEGFLVYGERGAGGGLRF